MNGWSPVTVTFDKAGDPVSVSVTEPRFTRSDVALLLASRRQDAEPRGGHGLLLADTTNPEFQYEWEVDLPTTDFAQAKLDRAKDAYRKSYPDADMGSLLWRVRRRD